MTTTLRSLKGGQKMSVGVFPFMLQLLVYVRGKHKNIRVSSVPSNTSCEERREAIVFTG